MTHAALLFGEIEIPVEGDDLIHNCSLFRGQPDLLEFPYRVQTALPWEPFKLFLEALQGTPIDITIDHAGYLSELSKELGFADLETRAALTLANARITALEQQVKAQGEQLARLLPLEEQFRELRRDFERAMTPQISVKPPPVVKQPSSDGIVSCPFQSEAPLDGIISYLTRRCGGNIVEKGAVRVTTSDPDDNPTYSCRNVVDFESVNNFLSGNAPNQWVCYDFGRATVKLAHYAIRSGLGGPEWIHLRNWILEGSTDGSEWIELDRRVNDAHLQDCDRSTAFAIAEPIEVRMVRLRQTGVNHEGTNSMVVNAFELFGELREQP
jgi:hypothetical protein